MILNNEPSLGWSWGFIEKISKLIVIAYEKNIYCLKLMLLQSFYRLKWNMFLTGVVYLIIDTYYYFIIPMCEWNYKFMCEWTYTWKNWYISTVQVKNQILK